MTLADRRLEDAASSAHPEAETDRTALGQIEDRVLWLATAMVDHANRVRPHVDGLKVGGHQASSASMVTIMTALWFAELTARDRVSVKPHASPVLHAINYLLGQLDSTWLESLRAFGGLQSYPSRSKDPDTVDYSTGSVGIGATAPLWGATAQRYLADHGGPQAGGRQWSLVGDAELDEGACWEAILDHRTAALGEVVWVVDLNRQSLDRVVPDIAALKLQAMFAAAGWQVITAKYGHLLQGLFDRPGGDALRRRIDAMANPEYQRLLRCAPDQLRLRLPGTGQDARAIGSLLADLPDETIHRALRNLGGHDLRSLADAYATIDDSRPTVIFAYTLKGYRLPNEGHPQNHSNLLTEAQMRELAADLGVSYQQPWQRFPDGSAAAEICAATSVRLTREPVVPVEPPAIPPDFGRTPTGLVSTQQALGRTLLDLSRQAPQAAARIVTVSPDVASSTNLGGWLNKVGVWSPTADVNWFADDAETTLHWQERPSGQHIELGIAETNLVGLLGELGATWNRWGEPLLPIGTLYDPFVARALEPWSFGIYAGGQSILVGTPSGVTLAPEGGAHQSIITPSIGLEQPNCVGYEPAFVIDTEWCLLAALAALGRPGGHSTYLRLSSRPVDQTLAAVSADSAARDLRRRQVVAGGYPIRVHPEPAVTIAAMGALVPEAIAAAGRLDEVGMGADVVVVTSPGLLYRAVRAGQGHDDAATWILGQLFPARRARPLVTVLDGHPHTLAFLAGINQVRSSNLGVSQFGQSGTIPDLYRHHRIDSDSIVAAALGIA